MAFKHYETLLALSYAPPGNKSILDWCPFRDGVKLVDIISEYNEKCFQSHLEQWQIEEFVENQTVGIDVVPYDLSTVQKMKSEEFEKIRFLLIDLDAIRINLEKEKLEYIRNHIDILKINCFLLQVSTKPDVTPYPTYFRPFFSIPFGPPLFPDIPEIIYDRETFKKALFSYCSFNILIAQEYIKALPR